MNTPVEAQSTSSLSNLLANPPRYPRNPTHQVHNSLVLYIVRVPGSKDVFLTTLKPPTKASISIEAVQSSLYFLHVERPEDDALRESLEAVRAQEKSKDDVSPIQRKPLPATPYANYPASQKPPTPPKSYPHYQPPLPGSDTATQAERYSARGANLRLNTGDPFKAPSLRKPVGARPMPSAPHLEAPSPTVHDSGSASPSPIEQGQTQFRMARKPIQPMFPAHTRDPARIDARDESPTSSAIDPPWQFTSPASVDNVQPNLQPSALRITLIRRDPASGSQWNVGSIVPQAASGPLHEVDIELSSPGYVQFAKMDAGGGDKFRRKVAYFGTSKEDLRSGTRRRSNSAESSSGSPHRNSKKPRRSYAFISPWQGMCAFSNGLDGKSLRCRQVLPGANASMPSVSADVAELRFNLPWATLRLKDPHKRQGSELSEVSPNKSNTRPDGASNREQWRKSFQVLTHKARKQLSISDNNGDGLDEHRLSLDLGREKAGGGFKGHSAKLGKLIIHDEGLKMCDLVVASCMGVWWQQYAGEIS